MRRLANFIGGESVAPKSGSYVELINPTTGQPFAEMPVSNASDVDAEVAAAEKAFSVGSARPPRNVHVRSRRSPTHRCSRGRVPSPPKRKTRARSSR